MGPDESVHLTPEAKPTSGVSVMVKLGSEESLLLTPEAKPTSGWHASFGVTVTVKRGSDESVHLTPEAEPTSGWHASFGVAARLGSEERFLLTPFSFFPLLTRLTVAVGNIAHITERISGFATDHPR